MKRDYDKRVFYVLKDYNTDEIEGYLNTMAQKGYALMDITEFQMFFKKETPRKIRYSLVYVPNEENLIFYRDYGKSVGWNFSCSMKKFLVFFTEDEALPNIETDETKYEVIKMIREKKITFDLLKLCALVIAAICFSLNIGLAVICLSIHGLGFIIMGICYGLLLVVRITDTFVWYKKSALKLQKNEKLNFRFYQITKKLHVILYSLMFVFYIFIFVDALYRMINHAWTNTTRSIYSLLFFVLFYLVINLIGGFIRHEFQKRGGSELFFINFLFLFSWMIICIMIFNGFSSKNATYTPEYFGFVLNEENYSSDINKGTSFLGSTEYGDFWSYNEVENTNFDYSYYLYKSNFPLFFKLVTRDALKTENLSKYLEVYEQKDDYTIYTASNKKIYQEDAEYQTFDTDLEYNDGCIVIQRKNELLIFYYTDFGNKKVDDIIESLNY